MTEGFAGTRVVVTGGSRGIGLGIATAFVRAGARVALTGRDAGALALVAKELSAGAAHEVLGITGDVARAEDAQRMAGTLAERFGGLDVLCANAGIFPEAALATMTVAQMDEVYATNVRGTMLSVQACLPLLSESPAPRVVLTSSITGPITGLAGWTHYGASKAAQLGFMRSAAVELAPLGITVNAVLPGNILTEGLADLGEDYLASMAASIPFGRLGDVADVAQAVLFFASPAAGYVTGQSLAVDGGQVLPESLVS